MNFSIVATCVCVRVCMRAGVSFLFCFVPSSAAKGKKHGRQQNKTNRTQTRAKKCKYILRDRERKKAIVEKWGTKEAGTMRERRTKAAGRRKQAG